MSQGEVTQLLDQIRNGNRAASDDLFQLVHRELRKLASAYMRNERRDHTLQPTALVHEAYIRLVDQRGVTLESRAHFFGIAANVMRRVLIDHARARRAEKRGRGQVKVSLDDVMEPSVENEDYLIELDQALERLAALDPRQARVVELRFFGGLSVEQTAEILGTAPRTIVRDWRVARAWLRRQLEGQDSNAL